MFYKIAFSTGNNWTAGLVLGEETLDKSISELSRLFPYFESHKMETFHRSPPFDNWHQAFEFTFIQHTLSTTV